ncbi:MAG: Type III pantothenate kinase [Lentisphaerae bacterium ADurb.BinA184]|nr:MAG: Type III pantothenate kinase [Lentisphaerae bacterium ADurb.BinA184]
MDDVTLLNIGNTHAQIAGWRRRTVCGLRRIPGARLAEAEGCTAELAAHAGRPLLLACVSPPVGEAVCGWAAETRTPLCTVSPSQLPEVDFSGVDTSTLGADRVANLAAALHLCRLPVIVMDCGSAITTEVLDAERRFRGGAIAPGRALARRALHEFTGQLPLVEMQARVPSPLGTATRAAILAGIDLGALGTVARLIESTRGESGLSEAAVVVTGGDRAYFAANLPSVEEAVPDFTLQGMGWLAEKAFRK